MEHLLQTDPRWENVTIGNTNFKLKNKGCTITCVSMASDYFGDFKTPDWLAKNLDFTDRGLIIWKSIGEKLNFTAWRKYGKNDEDIKKEVFENGKVIILRVSYAGDWHWVVLNPNNINFWNIIDPLNKSNHLVDFYGSYDGYVILAKKEEKQTIKKKLEITIKKFQDIWHEEDKEKKQQLAHEGAKIVREIKSIIGLL